MDDLLKQVEVEAQRRARLQEETKLLEKEKQTSKLKEKQLQQVRSIPSNSLREIQGVVKYIVCILQLPGEIYTKLA